MRRTVPALILLSALAFALIPQSGAQSDGLRADFEFVPAQPFEGHPVQFDDRSQAGATPIVAWFWDFGDGTNSTLQHPTHRFGDDGVYTVRLLVRDAAGEEATTSRSISIARASELQLGFPLWLHWVMPAIASTILLALGGFVLARGQPNIYNRVFFLLCLASGIKGYTEGVLLFVQQSGAPLSPTLAQILILTNIFTAFVYAPIFLWFVLVFPRPVRPWLKDGGRGAWTLLLAIPFLVLFLTTPHSTFQTTFNVYASILTLGALGLLVYHAWETDSDEERHRLRLLSATFFIIVFNTIVISVMDVAGARALHQGHATTAQMYDQLGNVVGTILAPVLEIVGLFLVMYGILRYQLLGVEKHVKRITRGAMFALIMFVTFVTVGNSAEYFIEERLPGNVPAGFLIAGFVAAIVLYPVQKGTERIANRWFPEAHSTAPDYLASRRMEIYEAQLRYALLDGHLKEKELNMLRALSESIGIAPKEVETVAQKFPGIDVAALLGPRPVPVV
jgi:PKD repeat protein